MAVYGEVEVLVFVFILVCGTVIYFMFTQARDADRLAAQNALSEKVNKAYIAAFNAPFDEQLVVHHETACQEMYTFTKSYAQSLPYNLLEREQKKVSNQKQAISDHKSYLELLDDVEADVTENLMFQSLINRGLALGLFLRTTAVGNDTEFDKKYTLDILKIRQARYQLALAALKSNPTNPDLHTHALQLGREYAESTRAEGVVTLFDETALANDIRAVTANAAQVSAIGDASSANPTTATASLDERIAKLLKLKAAGLLSDAEFEQKRQALIDEV